jgi:hypothetical protein
MSYDESDAAEDEFYSQMVEDFYREHGPQIAQEAVDAFQTERLQSYFSQHPALIAPAALQLERARALRLMGAGDASIVFAASATELALKQALLKPIVFGLVQSTPAAVVIAELSLSHAALDRFKNLLLDVLSDVLGSNLRTYSHQGAAKPLWEEIRATQDARNAVLHRGEARAPQEVNDAIRVAEAVVEALYPAVVGAVGLHLHAAVVCTDKNCKPQRR